ncbi:MAG: DUF1573 domain-containing protein [Acidobacteria bacterium]|nr:DUF1573 domain-containing protein [Acidobacteriota bacterium]
MRGRGVLLAVALVLATTVLGEEARGPRIRVEPESFDFGKVLPDRTLRKEFRLRNLGDEALVIERISKSCGCTAAATEVSTLAPGESTPLRVTVETRTASGTIEHEVLVQSNDSKTPTLKIRLRATVVTKTR